ncbi:translation initiation factor IF-2 associated domain-containing protein [Acinetobacter baumannii]
MTDKSIKELALSVGRPVEKLLEQAREAGLPQRTADDIITTEQQDTLVNYLKKVHGQESGNTGKIALKRKTTSTAKVASTSGKAKTINVEVRKNRFLLNQTQNKLQQKLKRVQKRKLKRVQNNKRVKLQSKKRVFKQSKKQKQL